MQIKTNSPVNLRYRIACTILAGVIATSLFGCSNRSDNTVSRSHSAVSENSASMARELDLANVNVKKTVERIPKKDGWIQIEISKSKVKIPRKALEGEDGVFVSTLIPENSSTLTLSCGSDATEPEMVKRCGEFPFGSDYAVQEVSVVDIRGRPFCYRVAAFKLITSGRGGLHSFAFYDEDGDGIFETINLNNGVVCEIPLTGDRSLDG